MPGPDTGGCAHAQTEAVSSAPSSTSFQVVLDSPSLDVRKTERSFREVTDYDRYHAMHFFDMQSVIYTSLTREHIYTEHKCTHI